MSILKKYNSIAVFAPDDKTKSELAKEEREKIEVTNTTKEEDVEDEEKEKTDEETEVEAKSDNKDDSDTDNNVNEDDEKETKEEVAAKAKEDRRQERMQRRIDKATAEAKAAKDKVADLERQLAAKPDDEKVLTEDEVEKRSEEKAIKKAAERAFIADCNKLAEEAEKNDKEFTKKINVLTEDIGPIPSQMIGILSDLENGAKILNYLTDNEDVAEDIWKLSSAKMALKLSKISLELEKKPKKEISKVPEPNKPLGGKAKETKQLRDDMPMEDWVKTRERDIAEARERKRAAYR